MMLLPLPSPSPQPLPPPHWAGLPGEPSLPWAVPHGSISRFLLGAGSTAASRTAEPGKDRAWGAWLSRSFFVPVYGTRKADSPYNSRAGSQLRERETRKRKVQED